ncbi:IclR family transcriptional regulator BlcR [soil metagenome]
MSKLQVKDAKPKALAKTLPKKATAAKPADAPQEKISAPAVIRASRVLDLISESPSALSLAELARMLDVPKSSLHGLCATLVQLRLVRRLDNGQMTLGPHVMNWANAFLSRSEITQEFYAMWEESGILPQETVTLSVLDGPSVVYIACRNGTRPLGVTFRIGMRLPAPYTATGKAMLSTFSHEDVRARLKDAWPKPLTPAGTPSLTAFINELEDVRERGYSIDAGEVREGMYCFGAPIFDSSGRQAVAGVAVSLMAMDATEAAQKKAGKEVRKLADKLSERMGAYRSSMN